MDMYWYGHGLEAFKRGEIIWLGDENKFQMIQCALLDASYVPDQANHRFYEDVVAHEVVGQGYQNSTTQGDNWHHGGGKPLNRFMEDISYDPASRLTSLKANNLLWQNATISARYLVLWVSGNGGGQIIFSTTRGVNDHLIAYGDMGSEKSSNGGDFAINWADRVVLQAAAQAE